MTELIPVLSSLKVLNRIIEEEQAISLYLSSPDCNICRTLKPRVYEIIRDEFPKLKMYYINAVQNPEIAGQLSVFIFPTLIVYFEKKEFIRKSRSFGLEELRNDIFRTYSLLFD